MKITVRPVAALARGFERRSGPAMGPRQNGLSLVGLVFVVVIVGFLMILGLRITPTFVEYRAINAAIKKAKASANTIPGIQQAFDRSAAIDDITVMSGKDLDIVKVNDDFVVSYAYTKKIPLFGPVNLTIDYAGSSKSL